MSSNLEKRVIEVKMEATTTEHKKARLDTVCMAKNTKKNASAKRRKNARKSARKASRKASEKVSNEANDANDAPDTKQIQVAKSDASIGLDTYEMPGIFTQVDEEYDFLPPSIPAFFNTGHNMSHDKGCARMISKWTTAEEALPLMNVIVCVRGGLSYDPLYEAFQPNVPNGRTAVYIVPYSVIPHLHSFMMDIEPIAGEEIETSIKKLCRDISTVNKEDVVFYYECCSHCTGITSMQGSYPCKSTCSIGHDAVKFIAYLLKVRKIMVMCADFSLKGLINDWETELLGPNPFVLLGDTNIPIKLKFKQQTLLDSGSAQLENVGKLSEKGTATVGVMPSTIVYSVNKSSSEDNDLYDINVLTVSEGDKYYTKDFCTTSDGDHSGTAGQVMITYKEGGSLLVSNGHFLELQKLDTTITRLLEVAAQEFGQEYSNELGANYRSSSQEDQKLILIRETSRYVSGVPPCQRSQSQSQSSV
jgi:hypothetical protein